VNIRERTKPRGVWYSKPAPVSVYGTVLSEHVTSNESRQLSQTAVIETTLCGGAADQLLAAAAVPRFKQQ